MKSRLLKSLLFLMATSAVLNSFAMMQIFVKIISTPNKTITLDIDPSMNANQLYQACSDALGYPIEDIRLILAGKVIPNDSKSIAYYHIEKESVLHLTFKKPGEKSADSSVKIVAGRNSISVNYTPGKTTNHDMYLKAAALEVPGWEIASLETLVISPGGAVFGAIKINNDDNVFSINPKNEEIYANLIRTTSLPTRVDDSSPAGAGSGSSAPMVEKLYAVGTLIPINIINFDDREEIIQTAYTAGVTTNNQIYLMALPLAKPGFEVAKLIVIGNDGNPMDIKKDDNLFEGPSSDNGIKAILKKIPSLPAGAGAPASADLRAETALEEAVAIEAIEEVLSDIETVDLNNLAHVEAKLQQLGATYNGLTTINLDEKQAILRTILEYKKIKAFKAIHTLLKHNKFKI